MIRFFAVWAVLGITATIAAFGLGLAVFRFVDVTFPQFAILLIAPGVQAAVLCWPAGLAPQVRSAWIQVQRHPLTGPVLLLEGLLLVAGLAWWSTSVLGFGAIGTVQPTWIAVKAVAAGAIALLGWTTGARPHRVTLVTAAVLIASQALTSRIEFGVQSLIAAVPSVPEVWLRLAAYGLLCSLSVMGVQRVARGLSDDGRFWIAVAVAGSVPAAVLVLLSMFNHPGVLPPWRGLALLCASVSVTALLLAVLTQSTATRVQS